MALPSRMRQLARLTALLLITRLVVSAPIGTAKGDSAPAAAAKPTVAKVATAAGFDVSPPMRATAKQAVAARRTAGALNRPERGPAVAGRGFAGDGAVQRAKTRAGVAPEIAAPSVNFEGIPGSSNVPILGGIPIPPDPVGDVGPTQYVEMVNTAWAVYSKTGSLLLGPLSLASIWDGFEVPDCEDNSGDPIVVHDQLADRWILTQFTTLGPTYDNCLAVSTTPDATGSYYRYAFSTGPNFPDYPKYGVWPHAYVATTREFAPDDSFAGIGVYGLERAKMLRGNPTARAVSVLYPPGVTPWITGDGWLPSDLDGNRRPPAGSPNYLVGTQDDEGPYGAPSDAINLFKFFVSWGPSPSATLTGPTQLPVAEFDSDYPCVPPGSRNCIPSPGPASASTSSPTGSGRPGGWPTATSAAMSRWSPASRSRPGRASPAWAGTSCAAPATSRSSTSRAPTRRPTASTAGWAASPRTRRATWPSATASLTAPTCSRGSATPAGCATTWPTRCPRARP